MSLVTYLEFIIIGYIRLLYFFEIRRLLEPKLNGQLLHYWLNLIPAHLFVCLAKFRVLLVWLLEHQKLICFIMRY